VRHAGRDEQIVSRPRHMALLQPWAGPQLDFPIDDPRLNKTAQFEQVVPVAAVARKPRCVEAEDRADFAGA
jgi:hypothetical protein